MFKQNNYALKNLSLISFLKLFFIVILASISIGYISSVIINRNKSQNPQIKPAVTISGNVKVQRISFTVYPEKRIPATNNWGNQMLVQIKPAGSSTVLIQRAVLISNSSGLGVINLAASETLPPGNYDFSIKGISHLKRNYNNYSISHISEYLDFSLTGKKLLAGDTSVVVDNYVNALDISTVTKNFYTGVIKEDLNRDGLVNSLDLSIQIGNLFKAGET